MVILAATIIVCGQAKKLNGEPPPRRRTVERAFINMMLEYSARKKRAKGPPAYSTLKPETNSDSPSARSKGVRLVSASEDVYQITAIGIHVIKNQE